MELKIQLAVKGQAIDCLSCVKHSELWETYFKTDTTTEHELEEMIAQRQVRVALNQDDDCIGFMAIVHNGCFRKFSYLSLIAVKSGFRGRGVGKELLKTFEKTGFEQADRVFLLVSDFNQKARLLYKKSGYQKVGEIPDLFRKGISEHVLVKYKL